jgi:DNA ligase-1
MLASPEPTADAIWARFADNAADAHVIYVEDKFDGIRAQLHRGSERVEIFSRDLRRMTDQFPEITERAREFESDVILDGEIMAFEQGRKLTFFDLQKRLGRKAQGTDLFAAASADVPVVFVAFDLLLLDGRSLLKTPLRERRDLLRGLQLPPQFQLSEVFPAHSADEIEAAFGLARRRMNEGLMVKDPESLYSPGRRGMFWFKLKKELATLDVVVVAAELGHGKRNHVLSDYTFAVRDDVSGELLPIGKAYSGLTDVEIAELTEHFKQNTVVNHGRYREVKPDTVLEVAFDAVQPSTRHRSGFALRFPRIKAIRRDKTVDASIRCRMRESWPRNAPAEKARALLCRPASLPASRPRRCLRSVRRRHPWLSCAASASAKLWSRLRRRMVFPAVRSWRRSVLHRALLGRQTGSLPAEALAAVRSLQLLSQLAPLSAEAVS